MNQPRLARSRSLVRTLAYALRRVATPAGSLVAQVPVLELSFRLPIRSGLARHLYKYRSYEPAIGNWILDAFPIGGGGLFVDIGANFGWYSCLFSRLAGGTGRVVAFEPEPGNFGLLEANLLRNGCRNVSALREGLADRPGELELHLYKASNPGRHSLLPTPGGETVRVPVVALDDRLAALGLAERPVDLIKIDIEGFELSALRGASATLSRCRNMVIEYSPDLMRRAGIEPSALIDLLDSSGMQVSMFGETGMVEVDATALRTLTGQADLLWQRLT
ncbi:FkbM family methyltransferase [Zeimonas arvi]|uniref:FkbM family methyltransferase n=1 Tax=Zeimonas arvi TaxID=2498847 RepID=UPI00164F0397|nr:FkbM family methyltransferase [Zeimonas arvi]